MKNSATNSNTNSTSDGLNDQPISHLSRNDGQIVSSNSYSARITFISPSIVLEQFYETSNSLLPNYILHGTPKIGKPYTPIHNSVLNPLHHNAHSHMIGTDNSILPSLSSNNQNSNIGSFQQLNDLKLKKIVLACVTSTPKVQYSWLRNGLPILPNESIQQLNELLIIKLYRPFNLPKFESNINDLTGRFECRVTNFTNSTSETSLELNRQLEIKVIKRISAKFLSNAQVIKAGQRAELNCTIEGLFTNVDSRVDFFKDGKPLLLNSNSHLFTSSHHHPADSTADHHSHHSHVLLNNFSKLNLRETGKHSNEDLSNGQKSSYSAILKLRAVKRENSGIYQCIARDGSQSAQASMRLVVEDEIPRFLEVFTERALPVNSAISMKCMASGKKKINLILEIAFLDNFLLTIFISYFYDFLGNPLPQITWSLDDQPLDSVSGILDNTLLADSPIMTTNDLNTGSSNSVPQQVQHLPSLANELNNIRIGDYVTSDGLVVSFVNISSLEAHHGGLFRCTAYSELAVVSHQAEIRLIDAKLFVRPMRNQRLVAHNDLRTRCPVTYSPDNLIEWYKGKFI